MEKKISDLDYSEIAAAINGYLNSEASIKQYVLSDLGSEISKLRDSKEALNSTWDGSAKKAFSSAVESDVSQMTNFSNLIEQYCSALDNIIANYETTEATNANTVAQRKY